VRQVCVAPKRQESAYRQAKYSPIGSVLSKLVRRTLLWLEEKEKAS